MGEFDAALGDFGFPLYGRTLIGQVKYNAEHSGKACTELSRSYISDDKTNGILNTTTVPVAIVERGGCYFAEKAYYAQDAGAKALLIMDDKDERLITVSEERQGCAIYPFM